IIELVKKTQGEKPAIQRLGDQVSAVFVPVVVAIAILTFLAAYFIFALSAQQALMNAVAVLVISCPCAMGLATPTAVSVGLGRAAKRGILIKGGLTIESFAKVQKIVFDKTGTLTTGKFKLQKIEIIKDGLDESYIKSNIIALAERSSHPISVSLKNEFKDTISPADLFAIRELKGKGMTGKNKHNEVVSLGSEKILNHHPELKFNLYLSINGEPIAGLQVEDQIKPGAKEMIETFHQQGIETIMLSGDKKDRCKKIADELGIKHVYSEQLPEQKLEIIRKLASETNIAMVGDGVNDAPALSLAQTGISPGDATQVAVNAAQVVLLNKENLESLAEAWKLSKLTLRTIKQNLFWAFFYNVLAIPLAAMGYLSPMIAAFSMAFSDVIVIGNSIWLKRKKLPE
ncbi:MAG: heavy metal translocating P-type ATPase, partial [Flavobacteriales bacterium]